MSVAPFSFHCVICINSFDLIDRPPVVLPCGHTFICEPCSKRIDRCMECREPLFIKHNTWNHTTPQNEGQGYQGYTPRTPVSRRSAHANSSRYGTSPQPPQKKVEKIPLPLPRNLVLISLMETASKRQLYHNANGNLMDDSSDTDNSIPNEDQVVLDSMDVLSSACGTYAVREQYGLPLHKGSLGNGEIASRKPALILKYGQKVQVVDAHEGVYTLARNAGTVFANSSQLVKVGVPKERSCKLEGIINSIQTSKAEISQRMNDLLQTESHLRSDLEYCLSQPPSHSVIEESEDTFPHELNTISHDTAMTDNQGTRHRSLSSPSVELISSSFSSPIPNQDISGSTVFIGDESFATPTPASPTSMSYNQARNTPTMSTVSNLEPVSPFSIRVMCGASLMPLFRNDEEVGHERSDLPIQRPSSEDSVRNFEHVDFRTGFSGHAALNKARKGLQSTGRSAVRMMGQHGGAVPFRRGSNRPSSPISDKKSW